MPLWTIFTYGPRRAARVDVAVLGGQRAKRRLDRRHRLAIAADHQAEAVGEPPDPAGDPGVDVPDAVLAHCAWRRTSSWKLVLPPSTIVSPGSDTPGSSRICSSVASPAGTMIQATRGFASSRRGTADAVGRGQVVATGGLLGRELMGLLDRPVVGHDGVPVANEAADHVRPHPPGR